MKTPPDRPLTRNIHRGAPHFDIAAYERADGYRAVRDTLGKTEPAAIVHMVAESGLAGCGGGGFPTGRKWQLMPGAAQRPGPRYFVVNADEMEPGTFKDRLLLEGDPHQMIEGIILSAYALEANLSYIFVRGEYVTAIERLNTAIAEATAAGLLGQNILGSGYNLSIHVHAGAGRYICGEETALLNALEGHRAIPRAKPPFPQISGLWGCPTIVNNVETICNIPHIVRYGAAWYRSLGINGGLGTKIYGVSGRVNHPGAFELPMGTTLRDMIEHHAGGMKPGYELRAVLPGGASTGFLPADQLDVSMTAQTMAAHGTRLGTGTAIVLDDHTCPIGFIANLQQFFARESCGWCAPCRDGLPWVERILKSIEAGTGVADDLDTLEDMTGNLGPGRTFCALAPGAMASLQTGLRYFSAEFTRHIETRTCAWT
ncbi:NADH-quinone oxidoreductase subunit NuoF [Acidiphilium sp. PA]|uniref:NADH-quinone oxidoreductase subunit NuoF n=1 Tax=Acidiphilium sp. PA TaxID=2871705 RepID=UPI0022432953|nr:NADH-quinone oxidoreductase subunit NuoF [Acidiphilium sp. PA]MCW8306638.1 NADH-quinone oxidoreductase subunit NuoF [Acidiphilium sp. PA]